MTAGKALYRGLKKEFGSSAADILCEQSIMTKTVIDMPGCKNIMYI